MLRKTGYVPSGHRRKTMNMRTTVAVCLLMAVPMIGTTAEERSAGKTDDESSVPIGDLVARVHKKTGKDFILDPTVAAVRISLAGLDPAGIDYPMLLAVL